jgi:hypothetical protein
MQLFAAPRYVYKHRVLACHPMKWGDWRSFISSDEVSSGQSETELEGLSALVSSAVLKPVFTRLFASG